VALDDKAEDTEGTRCDCRCSAALPAETKIGTGQETEEKAAETRTRKGEGLMDEWEIESPAKDIERLKRLIVAEVSKLPSWTEEISDEDGVAVIARAAALSAIKYAFEKYDAGFEVLEA
jgi:hypothetical protein